MKKVVKKFLLLLIICSLILTTNSITILADGLNTETGEITNTVVETKEEDSEVKDNITESNNVAESSVILDDEEKLEETTEYDEESEEKKIAEEPENDETETTIEDTIVEETIVEETSAEKTTIAVEENTAIEKITKEKTTEEEIITSELDKKDALLGDGENKTFTFKMQDDFGWYNSEDGDTTIEYDSSDDIVIPVVYPAGGHSAGYVWIDYGWAKDVGGHSGPTMTENQLQELINNWKTNPTEDIAIYPNFEHFSEGNIKTLPSKLNYTVGQDIDPAGIVFELTKDDKKKEVPYALPQYARLYSKEILDADKNPIGWDTVTADAKYCRFHFDDMIYQDVELTVNVPHTFTFVTNEYYPEDFGYFDADHTINVITYNSSELDTHPIEIPLVYNIAYQDTGAWVDVGWLLWKGEHEHQEWLSDDQLSTLVENWKNNPNEDVKVRVDFSPIYHSSLKQAPNKIDYVVGEEIDPTGIILEVSDEIFDPPTWTKDIAYDAIQYKDLFAREILDADKNSLGWDTVTADTKYCRFRFKTSVYEDVELNVKVPRTFTFEVSEDFGHFNAEDGPTSIQFKSEELDTKAIKIPVVYLKEATSDVNYVNVGWVNNTDGDKIITDAELEQFVMDWSRNPDQDMKFTVNFETIELSNVKVPPRVEYWIGDTFDPTELVIEVSDADKTWTKNIPYDSPEFTRLYSYKLLDRDDQEMSGYTITAETKYCKFKYNNSITETVEISILKEITEISLVKEQDWKEYSTGEKFDAKGLIIHIKYSTGEEEDVAYNDKRLLFLFNPLSLTAETSEVTVIFGGKTATTHVTMVDNAYVLYYYNKDTDSVHSIYTYSGDENNVISALNNAISSGAKGFYRVDASGFYDGYKNYNKDTERTLTRDEALTVYREEYDGNSSIYIGAAFIEPEPPTPPTPPAPTPTPYYPSDSGGGGGGSSSPSVGPMGDLTKNPLYQQQFIQQGQINSINNIPQNNLIANIQLAATLLLVPENTNMPISNVVDVYGNTGFGKWQKVSGTTTWYFLTGDLNANGILGTAGFVSNGLYHLSWGSSSGWYCFNSTGEMQVGWQQINGRIYYFEPNPFVADYGKAVTGLVTINGQTYNFDVNGALIQ